MSSEQDKRAYGSDFMYAEDLLRGGQFHTAHAEISEVHQPGTVKRADGQMVDKWVIGFKGKEKRLCLCKTNARLIHLITGDPPGDAWIGKRITLQARELAAFGGCLGLRVIPPEGTMIRPSLKRQLGKPATHGQKQESDS